MGKKSRLKKEKRETEGLNAGSKKILKKMIREAKPEPFVIDGKMVYYNPLKKTLKRSFEEESYTSDNGKAVMKEMVEQYQKYLKQRYKAEKLAKENGIDPNVLDKKEDEKCENT